MIEQVIARVDAQVPQFKLVGEAADFQAAAEINPTAGPACFIFMTGESGIDNATTGRPRQRVHVNFAVVYAVKNVKDVKGKGNTQTLAPLKEAVRNALVGWMPTTAIDRIQFVSGNQMAFRQGWQWWMDTFKTQIQVS